MQTKVISSTNGNWSGNGGITVDSLSDWIRTQLAARNWTQADLAQRSGVSETSLSRILKGERKPRPETCTAIADAFEVDAEMVFRLAGLLPETQEGEDQMVKDVTDAFKRLDVDQRRDVLEYVLWRLRQRRERKKDGLK